MIGSALYAVVAVASLATAPLAAQQPLQRATAPAPVAASQAPAGGPRIAPGLKSFSPKLMHEEAAATAAAAADRTVITISTLGLVIIGILLILLLT